MALLAGALIPMSLVAQGLNTNKIDQALGRSGQTMGDIYRIGFPRTDLQVVVQGVTLRPGLALGSWAAFSGTDDNAMVMGDLVLLQDEINLVMEKLLAGGIEITAVHNHLLNETPRVLYMHYMGRGAAAQLAASLRAALAASRTPLGMTPAPSAPAAAPSWVTTIENALGRKGGFQGGVLSFGIPRGQDVMMDDEVIPPAEGVAESINFQDAGSGKVASTGDFVLVADEVNPVITALKQNGILVTALHSHMLTEEPRLFFLHFWGLGSAESVADGIKDALSHVSTK